MKKEYKVFMRVEVDTELSTEEFGVYDIIQLVRPTAATLGTGTAITAVSCILEPQVVDLISS